MSEKEKKNAIDVDASRDMPPTPLPQKFNDENTKIKDSAPPGYRMSRPVPMTMLYLTFISNGSWTLFTWRGHSNGDVVRMSLANLIAQSTCSAPTAPQKARRAGAMIVFVCYDDTQNPESATLTLHTSSTYVQPSSNECG
jgi:hypothetical protein